MIRNNSFKNLFKPLQIVKNFSTSCYTIGLSRFGIHKPTIIHHNLPYDELFKHEQKNKEGVIMKCKYGDTFSVDTGKFTGRSPKDKWIVKNPGSESEKNIWWGNVNKPISSEIFDDLYKKAVDHFNSLDECYVFDGYCGANPKSQKKVRFVHELAWQQHFVTNMFIRPQNRHELLTCALDPDFTIINACSAVNDEWEKHNLNSEVAIAFNIEQKVAVILGTWYGGENKKGIFSLMNYWLPLERTMPMHCSSNVDKDGNTALFFGLSGTGKTTLSADPNRDLIGDDEHGWDNDGIFNFEGGCYAKTINLSEENEPDIYRAIKQNALLENVYQNEDGTPDYDNTDKTQNGRVSYPIFHIDNWHKPQMAGHPKKIIFLTCDAFGVLPPVSKLTPDQAMYHFLSGYTAKVAGTERGVTEPEATFSACFGEAFLTQHPTRYADLLKEKINIHDANVYLVNTGWTGGPYGIGNRMSIKDTRSCIDAILSGDIEKSDFSEHSIFKFNVPFKLPGVSENVCNPAKSWSNEDDYNKQATRLAEMFQNNYKKYQQDGMTDYSKHGPIIN